MKENCEHCWDVAIAENNLRDRVGALNFRTSEFESGLKYKISQALRFSARWNTLSETKAFRQDWYKAEAVGIRDDWRALEDLKRDDLDHWGDEPVRAGFAYDHAGPIWNMSRSDVCNKKYSIEILAPPESLITHIPDKYDF